MATGGLFNAKLTYNATAGSNLDLTGDTVTKYNVGHGTTGVAYDLTINNPTNAISATVEILSDQSSPPHHDHHGLVLRIEYGTPQFGIPPAAQVSRPTTSLCFRKGYPSPPDC